MNSPTNQEIERYYFNKFTRCYSLPDGRIEFTDRPDVIIHGKNKIGIEIANLYISDGTDPASEQVQIQRRLRVLAEAQRIYRASGGRNIELSIDFFPQRPISKIENVSKALAVLAHSIHDLPAGQIGFSLFEHIPEIRFIYLNTREYENAKWRPVQGYTGAAISLERLQKVVHDKSNKVNSYQPCDQYWLLLVVDFMDPAQDQEIGLPESATVEITPFERVIIYKPQFEQVVVVPK